MKLGRRSGDDRPQVGPDPRGDHVLGDPFATPHARIEPFGHDVGQSGINAQLDMDVRKVRQQFLDRRPQDGNGSMLGCRYAQRLCQLFLEAAAAEVSVTRGRLKIHRIVAATDPGHVVNPQQVDAQVDDSFVYGLSALLFGERTVKDGRIEQQNFDTYNMMRPDEMPVADVLIMPSGRFWGGVGEPTSRWPLLPC